MPQSFIKVVDFNTTWFLVWSSIVDAPVSFGLSEDELRAYWRDRHGSEGMYSFERAFARAKEDGNSNSDGPFEKAVAYNRAGPKESILSPDEIVQFYCRERVGVPSAKALFEYRKNHPLQLHPELTKFVLTDEEK